MQGNSSVEHEWSGAAPSEESDDVDFVVIKGHKRKIRKKITAHWKGTIEKKKRVESFGLNGENKSYKESSVDMEPAKNISSTMDQSFWAAIRRICSSTWNVENRL